MIRLRMLYCFCSMPAVRWWTLRGDPFGYCAYHRPDVPMHGPYSAEELEAMEVLDS